MGECCRRRERLLPLLLKYCFNCKKLTNLVFMLRFGKLKVEKVSLLKMWFLHYPFFCGFGRKLLTLIYLLGF
mgnify:CR=1 FL=1